jgi:DnaJ-class molecular chaperone
MAASQKNPDSPDDYYALLGVQAGADGEALRVAWRRLAARWHPDRAGTAATARFQQLSAAYTVLSDPIARAAYDRRRGRIGGAGGAAAATAATGAAGANGGAGTTAAAAGAKGSAAATGGRGAAVPGVMLSRLSGPLMILLTRGAAHLEEEGYVTLVLNEREAAQGGMVMVSMRVEVWCPACGGKERPEPATRCPRCKGERTVQELYSAWLGVPPGVADGAVLTPSAELPGMVEPARFRVRMRGN